MLEKEKSSYDKQIRKKKIFWHFLHWKSWLLWKDIEVGFIALHWKAAMVRAKSHLPFPQWMERTWARPENTAGTCTEGSHLSGLMANQQAPETHLFSPPFLLGSAPAPYALGWREKCSPICRSSLTAGSAPFLPSPSAAREGISLPYLLELREQPEPQNGEVRGNTSPSVLKSVSCYVLLSFKFFQKIFLWKCQAFNKVVLS